MKISKRTMKVMDVCITALAVALAVVLISLPKGMGIERTCLALSIAALCFYEFIRLNIDTDDESPKKRTHQRKSAQGRGLSCYVVLGAWKGLHVFRDGPAWRFHVGWISGGIIRLDLDHMMRTSVAIIEMLQERVRQHEEASPYETLMNAFAKAQRNERKEGI